MLTNAAHMIFALIASILWVGCAVGIIALCFWFVMSSERWFFDSETELQAMKTGEAKMRIDRMIICYVKEIPLIIFFTFGVYMAISAISSIFNNKE